MTRKKLYIIFLAVLTLAAGCACVWGGIYFGADADARQRLASEISAFESGSDSLEGTRAELTEKIDSLSPDLSDKDTANKYYIEYKKENDALKEQLTELQNQAAALDAKINDAKEKVSSSAAKPEQTGKTYAVKSGENYTCPEKIPSGRYMAKGSGTLIVSAANGRTRLNENLDVAYDNSYTFDLAEKETVKTTGSLTLTELK